MLTKIWARFLKSEFSRNVSSQIMGTGLAQFLPFLATPLLTRLYAEEDFALYTSFFALATIFAVGAGGKYYLAIVLAKSRTEALRIFTLSNYITFGYAAILALLFLLFYDYTSRDIGNLIYFVPVYVLFFGIWSSFTNLSIRNKTFKYNAYAKVIQSVSYIIAAIGMGLAKIALYGLVFAKIIGTLASWLFLFRKSIVKANPVKLNKLSAVAKKYVDYPKYGVMPAFLNTISSQALILILTRFYSTDDLGHFGLTYMVLSAPLGLIGTSFRDVFYEKIATLFNQEKFVNALRFFKKSALVLAGMGLPICLILYFFGEDIFAVVFGVKWARSGEFASILSLSFLAKLVVSPLSSIFNAANRLKIASVWQIIYFTTTSLTLGSGAYLLQLEVIQLLYVYVIHEVVLYSIYFLMEYRMLHRFIKKDQGLRNS